MLKIDEIFARVKALSLVDLKVGIPKDESKRDESGVANASLMAIHEFGGTINIPAREGAITRYIKVDGSFGYKGRFRKGGNFQSFHQIPAHTIHIPERSIFRYTFAKTNHFKDIAAKLARAVAEGRMMPLDAVNRLGTKARDDLRISFTDGHLAPNSAKTIKKKKSSKPLIDTGQLRQSITYVVNGTSKK